MDGSDLVSWLLEAEHLSDVLRRLRIAQELTLQEVADYAGMAKSYISMIERGQKSPERDTLIALLLAAFSLPVPLANRVLLFAGYAPLHHRTLARQMATNHAQGPLCDLEWATTCNAGKRSSSLDEICRRFFILQSYVALLAKKRLKLAITLELCYHSFRQSLALEWQAGRASLHTAPNGNG